MATGYFKRLNVYSFEASKLELIAPSPREFDMDYFDDDDELDFDLEDEQDEQEPGFEDDNGEDTDGSAVEVADEANYVCDSCGEEIVVPLDFSQGHRQEYVEDCPVCCNPNVIFVEFDEEGEANVWSRAEQDRH